MTYTQVFEKPIVITPLGQAQITGWNCALIASFLNRNGWTPDGQLFSEAAASLLELLNRLEAPTVARCLGCGRNLTADELGRFFNNENPSVIFACECGVTFSMLLEIGAKRKQENEKDREPGTSGG